MKYKCKWFEPSYNNEEAIMDFSEFTDDIGYDDNDREQIEELEIGDSVILGMSDHYIERIE